MSAATLPPFTLNPKPVKRTHSGQPVWRNSYTEGQIEDRLWRPIGDGKRRGARRRIGAILKAAKELDRRTRRERQKERAGVRNGIIGDIGYAVLEAIYNHFVEYATGRCEPAIATIAEKIGHSYAATHAALRRLRSAGFIQWIRRSRPTDNKGEAGPQVEQISNAYALMLPEKIEAMIRKLLGRTPIPDDARWRREQDKREWDAMVAGLSATDFMEAHWDGDRLAGESLKRIAAMLDAQERESSSSVETGRV